MEGKEEGGKKEKGLGSYQFYYLNFRIFFSFSHLDTSGSFYWRLFYKFHIL